VKLATTVFVFCVAALLALGAVMLCSAPAGSRYFGQQMLWEALGIVACGVVAFFDYRRLKHGRIPWAIFALTVWLLIVVLVPFIGVSRGGARRWLNFHFMMFQPSELAKLTLLIVLAAYVERFGRHMSLMWKPAIIKGILWPGAIIGTVIGLIFLEPDYGTTMLLAAVSFVMLFVAGSRMRLILPVCALGLLLFGLSVKNNTNRSGRMDAFFNPEKHLAGKAYQQHQAKIALGSGGLFGVGLGDGRQKYGYVPENHTDFILSIVGEELGLIATLGVVLAFLGIALSGTYIASHASDRFGMMLALGITVLISLQAFINIGVVTMVLPNKGLPLPFVSYGGSSLVMTMIGVGLVLSVARHAHEPVRRSRALNPFNPREVPSTRVS
jgi:cell division protein FtsW